MDTTAGIVSASRGLITTLLPATALLAAALSPLLVAPGAVARARAPPPSPGIVYDVGGYRGWCVPVADTSYASWAASNRFHVGDQLYFRYFNDSVLLVDCPEFFACNATDPLAAFNDGATTICLDSPGLYCFMSGEPGHCLEEQRLIVRVMAHPADHPVAPCPASMPTASGQPGHGGGSGAPTAVAAGAGVRVSVTAAAVVLAGFVLMLQ